MFEHQPEQQPKHNPFSLQNPVPSPLHGLAPTSQHPPGNVVRPHGLASVNLSPEVAQHRVALMSHWVEKPPVVAAHPIPKAPAQPGQAHQHTSQVVAPDDSFDRVTQGEYVSERNAPAQLTLPIEMTDALNKAWMKSRPGGRAQEHGGLMVRNPDGSMSWLPGKAGTDRMFEPNFGDVKPGQSVLSTGHTHPYDDTEEDHVNVPFSGRDLSAHPLDDQRLSVVQSGQGIFASARTKEFENLVNARGDAARYELAKEIRRHWNTIFWCVPGDTRQKSEAATRATSAQYHLMYYAGKNGKLKKVDTSAEPQHKECFTNTNVRPDDERE